MFTKLDSRSSRQATDIDRHRTLEDTQSSIYKLPQKRWNFNGSLESFLPTEREVINEATPSDKKALLDIDADYPSGGYRRNGSPNQHYIIDFKMHVVAKAPNPINCKTILVHNTIEAYPPAKCKRASNIYEICHSNLEDS